MARPASRVAADLTAHARGLDEYLRRAERLASQGQIPRVDIHRAYAGAFLSFSVDLERAIEDIFMGLLMGRLVHSQRTVRALVTVRSEVVARKVVRGDRRYVDWLPYKQTRDRAEAFFSGGEPFASLSATEVAPFERVRIIRNALAHGSGHAMRQFQRTFTDDLPLPAVQRRPAGYLRGQHSVGQTRFAHLLAEAVQATRKLVP